MDQTCLSADAQSSGNLEAKSIPKTDCCAPKKP